MHDNRRLAFVGRQDERAALLAIVDGVAAGSWAAALIEGEAGIGKSRLLDEVLIVAEGKDLRVMRARGHELERSRPFGPLIDALGSPGSEEAAAVSSITGADEGPQYQLVEAMLSVVEELATCGPIVIAIDDLHWVDTSTLFTLHAIARRLRSLPVGLVLATRPTTGNKELDGFIEGLELAGGVRFRLPPLVVEEVDDLVATALGAAPGESLRYQVSRGAGNPLMVIELVRALEQSGSLTLSDGCAETSATSVPASIGQVLLGRFRDLAPETVELLRLAAVLGSSFEVAHLAALARRTTPELLKPIAEAVQAGLLDDDGPRLSFRHDLFWEALYEDTAAGLRASLHLEAARVLAEVGAPAAEVAEHFAAGASAGNQEAVRWLREAATDLMYRAPGIAAGILRRAVEIAGPYSRELDILLAKLAVARLGSGGQSEAEALAREALARDHDRQADGLMRLVLAQSLYTQGRFAEGLAESRTALAQPDLEPPVRAQILAESVFGHLFAGDGASAAVAGRAAVEEGERLGDGGVVATAFTALAFMALLEGRCADAVSMATTAADRAAPSAATRQQFPVHAFFGACLIEADRFDEARDALRIGRQIAEQSGQTSSLPFYQGFEATLKFLAGDWDDAVAEAETGYAVAEDIDSASDVMAFPAVLAIIQLFRNDLSHFESSWARGMAIAGGAGYKAEWIWWAQALAEEARGEADTACATLQEMWTRCLGAGVRCALPVVAPDLVRLLVARGDEPRAREVVAETQATAECMDVPWARAAALRCSGLVDGDPKRLVDAIEILQTVQRPLDLARTCEDAAAALSRHGRTSEAVTVLGRAADVYEALRADLGVARVAAAQRTLGVRRGRHAKRPARPASGWESLTATELKVAEQVAAGISNRQVAERLYISHRTVEAHLGHIFGKLGFASRGQLIAAFSQRV